jgi:DNA-binding beta-propeller fold protein YncE
LDFPAQELRLYFSYPPCNMLSMQLWGRKGPQRSLEGYVCVSSLIEDSTRRVIVTRLCLFALLYSSISVIECAGFLTATLVAFLNGTGSVLAIAHLNGQLFVTRAYYAEVSVYNTASFQLTRRITFAGLGGGLFGLATSDTNANYLYISDGSRSCVHRVDLSVPNTVSKVTWSVPLQPWGISVTSTGNVLVVLGANKNTINEYTPDGSVAQTAHFNQTSWYVAEVENGQWASSSSGSMSGISVISTNGTVIKSFGSAPGSGLTQMNDPRCFAIKSNGYIIATDHGNNRILLIDPTMTAARQLPLPFNTAVRSPIAIGLDQSRGRLYIGEDGGQKRVLVFNVF